MAFEDEVGRALVKIAEALHCVARARDEALQPELVNALGRTAEGLKLAQRELAALLERSSDDD
jgi:hypothetical protein